MKTRTPHTNDQKSQRHGFSLVLVLGLVLLLVGGIATTLHVWAQGGGPQEPSRPQAALGTEFTYQGRLIRGGSPISGTCSLNFGLYDALVGGSQVGVTQTVSAVPVNDGYFAVALNGGQQFGEAAFDGAARYLQISINSCSGGGGAATLSPRVALNPAPYALALPGLRTEQNGTSPNLVGGYSGNTITSGAVGAIIGGGGTAGQINRATDDYATVGGGWNNRAGDDGGTTSDTPYTTVGGGGWNVSGGYAATVGGGTANEATAHYAAIAGGTSNQARGEYTTVSGGYSNVVSGTASTAATIGGGYNNYIDDGGHATIGGGTTNAAHAPYVTIGGGTHNRALVVTATAATIGGGDSNVVEGSAATIGGGYLNGASGHYATVPGGYNNAAQGDYSLAAGYYARADHSGSFVWGDSSISTFAQSLDPNQFVARATGGVMFISQVDGSGFPIAGVYLAPGTDTWQPLPSPSDRNLKENMVPVDGQEILARLAEIPISTWNYKGQNVSTRHMGPMAQDFYAALGVGEDDQHISSIDASGVALAASQALHERVLALEAENAELEARIAALEELVKADVASTTALRSSLLPDGWVGLLALVMVAGVWAWRRQK